MKKNIIIAVLAIIAAAGVESTVFFHHQANKLHDRNIQLAKSLSEVREENKNLHEVVDSIDNPHHHDYLLSLVPYRALQK